MPTPLFKVTFIVSKIVELSDPDDPESSAEVDDLKALLEDDEWVVLLDSVDQAPENDGE